MAKPKDLIAVVAKSLGISEATVIQHDRNLMDGGLRSLKGRGRNCATMTATDAANLLVASAASQSVKDSATTVAEFEAVRDQIIDAMRAPLQAKVRNQEFIMARKTGDMTTTATFTWRTVVEVAAVIQE